MAAAGRQNLHGLDQIGFTQTVRPIQHVHSGRKVHYDLIPGTEMVKSEARNIHGCQAG